MQRPAARGMARGQHHRDPPSPAAVSAAPVTTAAQQQPPTSQHQPSSTASVHHPIRATTRNSSNKLKVLVRSHAMREETSPPREPSPPHCISIITSPPPSSPVRCSSPPLAAGTASTATCRRSPARSRHHSQSQSQLLSPGSPSASPGRCSPTGTAPASPPAFCSSTTSVQHLQDNSSPLATSASSRYGQDDSLNIDTATVRTQDSLSSFACNKLNGSSHSVEISISQASSKSSCEDKVLSKDTCAVTNKISVSDSVIKDTNNSSLSLTSPNQKNCVKIIDNNFRTKSEQTNYICDCFNQICTKCSKNNERNINNNLRDNINNNNNVIVSTTHSSNTLSVSRANTRHKLRHQSSSQGSFDGSSSTSPCLSRDSSTEQYTDCTGIDLQQFIIDTLNKNAKDRVLMLKIEMELVTLAKDKSKTHYKFPTMSSYQRMLVHRCAAYFGMDHNIEVSGKCVVVNKTKNTRIPETRFKDHIRDDFLFPEEPRRSILKRDSNSFEDCNYKSPDRHLGLENRRSKSFEEREEEYEKLQDCDSQEEFLWSEAPWPDADSSKIRLLPPPDQPVMKNRLLKVQSMDGKGEPTRPCVAKSYSFGGYSGPVSVLSRGDSVTSTHSAGPRLLTKQDSSTSTISWRLSPSSSGYKSQSQRSDSVTPSPTATPHQLSDTSGKNSLEEPSHGPISEESDILINEESEKPADKPIIWAVTDMQSVPKGSVLIDPQSGQPFTNQDGTIYHFDPSNPPPGFTPNTKPPPSPVKLISPRKSPVKEYSHSPKKTKSRSSPSKSKGGVTNTATSPSLPITPPSAQNPPPSGVYTPSGNHLENASNMPIQPYPVYPNGYVPNMANSETNMPVYPPPVGMMYAPYGVPQQFENRPDSSVTDLSGYFVNMSISDPTNCSSQPVSYQPPNSYWNQQPITYYQPPANQQAGPPNQRFPVQLSVAGQPQGTFVSAAAYPPPNYVPVPPTPPTAPPTTDLVPVYNSPMPMIYPPAQQNPNMFMQNPNVVYTQNPVYPQGYTGYPPNTPTPNSTSNNYSAPNFGNAVPGQCYNQMHSSGYDGRSSRSQSSKSNKNFSQRGNQNYNQSAQGSNHSSGGSSSPANTVISGYYPNTSVGYRQCTPPETPPTQSLTFGYPPNYMQQSMIFRPMGGSIRASPPVNMRSSRSPTPGPEFPQVATMDRSQRFAVAPTMYSMGVPCIIPGDVRLVGRAPPPIYKQPYRQHNLGQPVAEHNSNKSHKQRKTRTKVPALPPSGRQSNQPVSTHSRF